MHIFWQIFILVTDKGVAITIITIGKKATTATAKGNDSNDNKTTTGTAAAAAAATANP